MRHRKHNHTLGLKKEHRIALMANLGAALLERGRIQTTLSKAKALRPFVEKTITLAKKAESASPERALHLRRLAFSRIRDKKVVNNLFTEQVKEFLNRKGGYTRIYKTGSRMGDAGEMALIELIDAADEGYRSSRRKKRRKKSAPVREGKESRVTEEKPEEGGVEEKAEGGSGPGAERQTGEKGKSEGKLSGEEESRNAEAGERVKEAPESGP